MADKSELDKLADEGRALGAEISVRMKRMQGKSVLPEFEQLRAQLAEAVGLLRIFRDSRRAEHRPETCTCSACAFLARIDTNRKDTP
jgi:hypothetical protein